MKENVSGCFFLNTVYYDTISDRDGQTDRHFQQQV